jgi:sugar O-acyltransferase (sialic acid O-acetyltransferase NeuD family)
MAEPEPIFLFGAGGHGRAVAEVVRRAGTLRIACVLDDDPSAVSPPGTPPVAGGRERLERLPTEGVRRGFVAVGDNDDRERVMTLAEAAGHELVTIVDPAAVVASDATVGAGTALMPMSFVGAGASVGRGAIVNTAATVDHDCVIDDYAHISCGVHLSGQCRVGARSLVGIGASIAGRVTLGDHVVIGAGAAVVEDVPSGVVATGVPARPRSGAP